MGASDHTSDRDVSGPTSSVASVNHHGLACSLGEVAVDGFLAAWAVILRSNSGLVGQSVKTRTSTGSDRPAWGANWSVNEVLPSAGIVTGRGWAVVQPHEVVQPMI